MRTGDLIVMIIAGSLGLLGTISNLVIDGYVSIPYHAGQWIGAFILYGVIGMIILWVYRKIRDRNTPAISQEIKA